MEHWFALSKTLRVGGLLIFISTFSLFSQNLVPNPSFEQLYSPAPGCYSSMFAGYASEWTTPNYGTTDLLSKLLSPDCMVALPQSTQQVDYLPRGYQYPRTGNNVAGIKPLNNLRREYLSAKLECPLIPGMQYYAEMYVSLAEQCEYAQNNLGMYFSDTNIYVNSFEYLSYSPQINETSIISDSVNWVKISGTFTPTTAVQYLLIGNFFASENTNTLFLGEKGDIGFPYYYIDDVSVTQISFPTITITGDTSICKGSSLQLTAAGESNLKWYTSNGTLLSNTNVLELTPSKNTTYVVKGSTCPYLVSKSQQIVVLPLPAFNLGNDTLICEGSTFELIAPPSLSSYLWQDASNNAVYTIQQSGLYTLEASDNEGCIGKDSIQIGYYEDPEVQLGPDIMTCTPQGTLSPFTKRKHESYTWQDGSTKPSFSYSTAGTYYVTATNLCLVSDSDTITISGITLFIPNLITDNADNQNDFLEITGTDSNGSLTVYNRFGAEVYQNNQYDNSWNGKGVTEGIYYFEYSYPTCPAKKGWVQILR